MKIGIVTQSYYPIKGGVAEHVDALYSEMEKRGHEVVIVTGNFTGFDDNYGRNVIRIGRDLTVLTNGAFSNVTVGLQFKEQIRKIEEKEKFDIVHIHQPIDPVLPLFCTKYFKAPKIGTFHTYAESNFWLSSLNNKAMAYFKRLDGLIAVSEPAKEYITRFFPGEYKVIPNGIDTKRFSPEVKPFEEYENSKDFNILFLGRMDPRKGFKYMLRAFPLIYQKLTDVRLIVVGNGILRHWYNLSLPSILRSRVDYRGFVPHDHVPSYYAACDVFCSPATMGESFGIVLLEAMSSGKAVVASDITGYNSIVENNKEGILVKKKDPLAIAEAIISLAKDKKKREKMGQLGREKALNFDWHKVADEIEEYYFEVIKKKKS